MRQPLSLKGRAIALLAQREQSVLELRRKLMRHARAEAQTGAVTVTVTGTGAGAEASARAGAEAGAGAEAEAEVEAGADPGAIAERVEGVIDWLRAHDYLNEARFVEGRVHARAVRFGSLRIQRELAQHGLALSREDASSLRATEAERATLVWQRKFGRAPVDRAEQARQARFLVARGFSADVVHRLVRMGPGALGDAAVEDDPRE